MAGPHRDGPPPATVEARTEYEAMRFRVCLLRDHGKTHAEIAKITGYHQNSIWRLLKSVEGEGLDISGSYGRTFMLGMLKSEAWDRLMPHLEAMDSAGKFDDKVFNAALQTIDRMGKVMGAEAPSRTQVLVDAQVSTAEPDSEAEDALRAERRRVAAELLRRGGIGDQPPKPTPIDLAGLLREHVESRDEVVAPGDRPALAPAQMEQEPEVAVDAVDIVPAPRTTEVPGWVREHIAGRDRAPGNT